MKFDIIKTDYVKTLKGFSVYFRVIAIVALIFMILNLSGINLFEGNQLINAISISIIILFFIIQILNEILFIRIGVINFGDENIIIDKGGKRSKFDLSKIKNVEISSVQRKHYLIQALPAFEEIIELNENELTQLKDYFNVNQIEFKRKSIQNWMKKVFSTKDVT